MDAGEYFLKTWEKEGAATRKVIERIPEGSTYTPDPKSRPAREIAWLIVREEILLARGLESGKILWEEVATPATIKEILAVYDREHPEATRRLNGVKGAKWDERVPFMFGDQTVMNETALDNAWGFLLDMIHHRGQISTYLRPMGSTVPQIYGPSADEPM